MSCAACQATVQGALRATPGVTQAVVNLMTHEATVVYQPALVTPTGLVDAVNETGYVSHLPAPATDTSRDEAREQGRARAVSRPADQGVVSLTLGVRRHGDLDAADGRRLSHTAHMTAIRCWTG